MESSSTPPRLSVHRALGGGAVADVLLWRKRNASLIVAAGSTAAWILFDRAGYNPLSLFANALLLLFTILFFWARSASLLNRPLPPVPNLEISEKVVEKVADESRVWINRFLDIACGIAVGRDRKLFLQVILILWVVSYIGSFFSFLTLLYIGALLSLTVPVLYDKYQDHVDEKLSMAHGLIMEQYSSILSKTSKQSSKEKKAE